jgi:putative aldouronate transport system substrate-binding protein
MMTWRLKPVLLLVLLLALVLSACAGGATNAPQPTSGLTAEGKYDPPIQMVSVKAVDATFKFLGGDDIANNVWTRAYKDVLGIDLTYLWTADAAQYQQKLSLSVMSGTLPDVFVCNPQLFKLLYDSGLIADLTQVYEQKASASTKTILTQDPASMSCVTIDGKVMGIPLTDSAIATAPVLWIRQDWLNRLRIAAPASMQDVLEISRRFTEDDPDGNGVDDTIGLLTSKELWGAYGGLQGFFNGYHAYPRTWIEKDGALVNGTVLPEMRDALLALQKLYAAGQIDREFSVKDADKVLETIANGKCGMEFGVWWNPYHPLNLSQANQPDAYWQAFMIPSVDGTPAKSQYSSSVGGMIVVRKGYAYPEAAIRMTNFWCDNFYNSEDEALRKKYLGSLDNPDVVLYKYTDFVFWEPNALLRTHERLSKAISERNPAGLDWEELNRYKVISAYFDQGVKEAWVEVATNGEGGSVSILDRIAKGLGMHNAFFSIPTDTMTEKRGALDAMQDEVITKIIMGQSIDTYDDFIAEWKAQGGDAMTAEVDAWWKANGGKP